MKKAKSSTSSSSAAAAAGMEKHKDVLYIDMQCFNVPSFTPKEISFTYDGISIYNYLILPKVQYSGLNRKLQHTIRWLENNHHGISYNSGYVKYNNLSDIFALHTANLVVVKGAQKLNFLKDYYVNIINLEFIVNCPKFEKQLNSTCFYHNKLKVPYVMCSKHNVKILYNYVQENKHIFLI
jgi:hypothetical protein